MANLVKYKAALSGTSIVIIGLFYGMLNSFQLSPEERPWSDSISWSDFKGVPHYFRSGDAGIYSRLSLEYDSLTENYKVIALMNQSMSWHKRIQDRFSNDVLKHEQYHFNITEAYARLINKYIKDYPDSSLRFYQTKFVQIERELDRLQEVYDDETNHSLIIDQQAKWEYKIDSMLLVHSVNGDANFVDYYSGASVFFPTTPELRKKKLGSNAPTKHFFVSRDGVSLNMTVLQDFTDFSTDSISDFHELFYKSLNAKVNYTKILSQNRIIIRATDSINRHHYDLWHYEYPNTYLASAIWAGDSIEFQGLQYIAKSFINSFEIMNTDQYWLEKLDEPNISSVGFRIKNSNIETDSLLCFAKTYVGGFFGFIRGPIITPKEGILFAVDFAIRDSIRNKNFGVIDKMNLALEMIPPVNKIYYFTKEYVQNDSLVHLCYTRKDDPNPSCPNLYCQTLPLRR
jgi:hypothetical protein